VTGQRPWRCVACDRRFYADAVALRFLPVAHCSRCGNFDLQRISRDYVEGAFAWLFRLAQVNAYRCEPCRLRFFSVRPWRNIQPAVEVPSDREIQSSPAAK
jgi:hypothetical protein